MDLSLITDEAALRRPCAPVSPDRGAKIAYTLQKWLTKYNHRCRRDGLPQGIGLAAPQLGIDARVCVVLLGDDHRILSLINPVITARSVFTRVRKEGCLSFPGIYHQVVRPVWVAITSEGWSHPLRYGAPSEEEATERNTLSAAQILHEIDHLDGILFFDRAVSETDAAVKS